jgi:hypothetical protein
VSPIQRIETGAFVEAPAALVPDALLLEVPLLDALLLDA